MNFNDKIKVTLTPKGVRMYKDHWKSFIKDEDYPGLKDNVLTIHMWDFAYIFGNEMYMGNTSYPCEMEFQLVN